MSNWVDIQLIILSSNKGWDGMFKGIAVPTAVFVYQCSYQLEGMPAVYKKGTLLLAR